MEKHSLKTSIETAISASCGMVVNTNDLWEVRVGSAGNAYRILCFFDGRTWLVLNHAFCKKTQRTPRRAIIVAEQRKRDYLRRKQQS